MSLNESIVDGAALTSVDGLGYAVGCAKELARRTGGRSVWIWRGGLGPLRKAIRPLNQGIHKSLTLHTLGDKLLPNLVSGPESLLPSLKPLHQRLV